MRFCSPAFFGAGLVNQGKAKRQDVLLERVLCCVTATRWHLFSLLCQMMLTQQGEVVKTLLPRTGALVPCCRVGADTCSSCLSWCWSQELFQIVCPNQRAASIGANPVVLPTSRSKEEAGTGSFAVRSQVKLCDFILAEFLFPAFKEDSTVLVGKAQPSFSLSLDCFVASWSLVSFIVLFIPRNASLQYRGMSVSNHLFLRWCLSVPNPVIFPVS